MDTPVDQFALEELPKRWGPMAFLFPNQRETHLRQRPRGSHPQGRRSTRDVFQQTRRPAGRGVWRSDSRSRCSSPSSPKTSGCWNSTSSRICWTTARSPKDSFDLLGGLFTAMNTPGGIRGGRFQGVDYFDGGLFADPARIELYPDELAQLRQAAKSDWSKVRPEIFGTIFEQSTQKGSGMPMAPTSPVRSIL